MIWTWSVCRQFSPCRDGERRWDQAYQLLVRRAGRDGLPGLALIAGEVPDARSGVCAGAGHPPGPGADDRAAAWPAARGGGRARLGAGRPARLS
jgi:hypothetical protein